MLRNRFARPQRSMPGTKHENKKAKEDAGSNGSLDVETESNVLKIVEIEQRQRDNRTFGERVSDAVAYLCGNIVFVYVHVLWFSAWIVYNSVLPVNAFDPFPYTFLTMVVSLEAIFLSTFILISQNHDAKLTERRNHLDLQINMLAEQENTRMLELLGAIAEKVGVPAGDEAMQTLTEKTDPVKLVQQIMVADGDDEGEAEKIASGK
jgi:uncharacterized membrane protein